MVEVQFPFFLNPQVSSASPTGPDEYSPDGSDGFRKQFFDQKPETTNASQETSAALTDPTQRSSDSLTHTEVGFFGRQQNHGALLNDNLINDSNSAGISVYSSIDTSLIPHTSLPHTVHITDQNAETVEIQGLIKTAIADGDLIDEASLDTENSHHIDVVTYAENLGNTSACGSHSGRIHRFRNC